MSKILVTGASGDFGRKTVLHLLKAKGADQVVGLVRDPGKAIDLSELGIELRQADYMEPETLKKAMKGIDKVMLVSTHAFTDRKTAQGNVIDAAVDAGVGHLVTMSIIRETSFNMPDITPDDLYTEEKLLASGLDYTIAYHPPFMEALAFYIGTKAQETGIRLPPGIGKFGAATRNDLAEAHAVMLTEKGHESKSYRLYGDPAVSFKDIADILSELTGKKVPFTAVTEKQFTEQSTANGVPDFISVFVLRWIEGMNAGEWATRTKDLERLIGRKPTTTFEYMRDTYLKTQA